MTRSTLTRLRRDAVAWALPAPVTLAKAVDRLGFVQADPIRAPARAQDLILRHRVKDYRAGDLERRYPRLKLEEDVLYAYGFLARRFWHFTHTPKSEGLTKLEKRVLSAVEEIGEAHPRQLDQEFGRKRVTNPWGGTSTKTKSVLDDLHRRGLLRVARRDKGIRVYALAPTDREPTPSLERLRALVRLTARILAPASKSRLISTLAPIRRRWSIDGRAGRSVLDALIADGSLEEATVDGVTYVWPPTEAARRVPRLVRFLAPFDPLVWDRARFEHFWGWGYRFEAYTPKAKRVRGYYALPLLWGEQIIGWANLSTKNDQLHVELGFEEARPQSKAFAAALDAEVERMRSFLGLRAA